MDFKTAMTNTVEDDEEAKALVKKVNKRLTKRLSSHYSSGMETSVFRFHDVNFVVGKGDKHRYLLKDVSGKVRFGHVLAVMGPSGAGKTTLLSALTLDGFYGIPSGTVTLNGVKLTDSVFKRHCFVLKQHDKHWPYLTCRETLHYAAELYNVAAKEDTPEIVEETIQKMGLGVCADTRCGSLSGGEQRRLSIGVALLKQPTLLFLDEPTSGLDAAAAENIMQEIIRVAKNENLIIVCTIHQPSSKVYSKFDHVMLLSRGQEAFSGPIQDAPAYFDNIGYPIPEQMNPAEHFLDLVNSDFSSEEEVQSILDIWAGDHKQKYAFHTDENEDLQDGVAKGIKRDIIRDMKIMFRRHAKLIVRDPILYVGRCAMILVTNIVFGIVYWNARKLEQNQALNRYFLNIWYVGVATNMGVVAVYALNDEFKSILREAKNGMINPWAYILAKSVMVIPVIYIIALFALIIPGFLISNFSWEALGQSTIIWSLMFFCFESLAECLAVWVEDPIFGMLQFMNYWFMCFLFCGNFLTAEMLYWPFELFYHILPFSYYLRSATYILMHEAEWKDCVPDPNNRNPICIPDGDPLKVLDAMGLVYSTISPENTVGRDMVVILVIAIVFKIFFVVGVIHKTRRVAPIK